MEKDLRNKIVFITGSNSGIGKATALAFAKEGACLVITYFTDKEEALQTANGCREMGAGDVHVVKLNIMNPKSIKDAVATITKTHMSIDILINNAGIIQSKPLAEQSINEINDQIRTNLTGTILMTRFCLPYVKSAIINVGSGAGHTGYINLSVYCATKFGIRGFTQSLAQELVGINIYAVNPGTTATEMTGFEGDPPESVAQIILNTAKGIYEKPSGSDINVWDYL